MYESFFRERLTQLRMAKRVSERCMSLDLGHSSSYIHSIVSGKALPSMTEFFYICEYFGITPQQFFDDNVCDPMQMQVLIDDLRALKSNQLSAVAELVKALRTNP